MANFTFAHEYKKMLKSLQERDFTIDLNEREFMFERIETPNYSQYRKWKILTKKILKIKDL
jgi:hypothetical protein